jgi:hypothetical protein
MASVAGQQQTVDAIGDFYQKGVTDAMRIYQENATDDPYKKRFTDVQKGSVMGWCGVTSWAQVPKIWREIENSKSVKDSRKILRRHWARNRVSLHTLYYDIWWDDDLLIALRTVQFTEASVATFLTSESAFSLLHLMKRTPAEIQMLERQSQQREKARLTLTLKEWKAAERDPRLPPGTFEETYTLFTTYAMLLEMLFKVEGLPMLNNHALGLDEVRGQMLLKQEDDLRPNYFANIVWAVLSDAVLHFNECLDMDDIVGKPDISIVWLRSSLRNFATNVIAGGQDINLLSMPNEWRQAMTSDGYRAAMVATGRGGGRDTTNHNVDERQATAASGKLQGERQQSFRDKHPERYGRNKKNEKVSKLVEESLKPCRMENGKLQFGRIMQLSSTAYEDVVKWKGIKEGICAAFTAGYCGRDRCNRRHLWANELPSGYAKQFCSQIDDGIKKYLAEGAERASKRQKTSGSGNETKDAEE